MTETERQYRREQVISNAVRMQIHAIGDLRLVFNALDVSGREQMRAFEAIERVTAEIVEDLRRQMDKSRG